MPAKEQIIQDLVDYLGFSRDNVLERMESAKKDNANYWNIQNPQTPEEIESFYILNPFYIFQLANWHCQKGRPEMTEMAIKVCKAMGVDSILDYGCGIGEDGFKFAERGFKVSLLDLPCDSFKFAQWRAAKHAYPVEFLHDFSGPVLDKKTTFDAIICFDVLEHVDDFSGVADDIISRLKTDGLLLTTTRFQQDEENPCHLKKNEEYAGINYFRSMALKGMFLLRSGEIQIFRKVPATWMAIVGFMAGCIQAHQYDDAWHMYKEHFGYFPL